MTDKNPGARPRGAGLAIAMQSVRVLFKTIFRVDLGPVLPMVIALLLLALLLAMTALISPIAPFVYPLF